MDYKMNLTQEELDILNGSKGEAMAKVMKTLVMYGDAFGATKMVPVTSKMGHLVTSFGLKVMKPVYDLMDQLIAGGALSGQKFTVDPKPLDPKVPANLLQKLVFNKFMYSMQDSYDAQLTKLGLLDSKSYTCTCYMDEVGNKPAKGDVLSWAESSAVVYANSVLGARCNRNSGIIELFGSIVGFVPYFGLLTDEGRKATWVVEIKTTKKPEAQILGSAIGMKVMEDVPYVKGLDKWIGTELDGDATAYLKDFGAATASNGAVASITSPTSPPRQSSRVKLSSQKAQRPMSSTTPSLRESRQITPSCGKIKMRSRSSASSAARISPEHSSSSGPTMSPPSLRRTA